MAKKGGLFLKIVVFVIGVLSCIGCLNEIKNDRLLPAFIFGVISTISIILLVYFFYVFKNISAYILKLDRNIAQTEKESLYNFPAPTIIIDENYYIVWYNKFFEDRVLEDKEAYGKNLSEFVEIDVLRMYTKNGVITKHDGRYYRVIASKSKDKDNNLSMVYFEDISQLKALEQEHFASNPCVILIMVDNYEELLQNVKESEKAHILVQIETLLEKFMEPTTGILRRISNDKFYAVVEERHIAEMVAERFNVLDKAREIMISDRIGFSLSIGVGRGCQTIFESETFAKQALDMSLGRGGDQCAVKTHNGFEFFGGVSKGIEKNTKVKTRIIAAAITELVESHDHVYIMGHRFGDLDSIGSATGLCGAIRKMKKSCHVVVDMEKNLSKKLIDHVIKNDQPDIYITPEQALTDIDNDSLLIIVDTHNPEFLDSFELYHKVKQVVVIDHHRKMVNYINNAVIFFHEPYASSTSEMVAEIIQYFGDGFKITAPLAEALLAGIMLDTKNFVMRTGVRTFEAAAYLRKLGADTISVRNMFSSSIETYRQKSRLIAGSIIYKGCAIAITDSQNNEVRLAAPQAADELLGISSVVASFVLFDMNSAINVSARSLGGFNVQVIMEELGGGGHQTMAGAQLANMTLEAAKMKLFKAIDNYVEINVK